MKPKPKLMSPRERLPKAKHVKKEFVDDTIQDFADYETQLGMKPSVEIVKCISYQKFRYSGENRPGKKYQDKEFMTLKLCNLSDKVVRIVIICTDAENKELIHPNGLVGKDCHDGIYDKEIPITNSMFHIKIPYLRTERIKTKKNEHEKIQSVLQERAMHLPSPYRERCLSQCTDKYTASRKFETTKVCLGVIVTVLSHQGLFNGSLHAISHVVRNASEKTLLGIHKLSQDSVSALTGGEIDIFTTEDGPAIETGKYWVYVTVRDAEDGIEWMSKKFIPGKDDILYKRVIKYKMPNYAPNPNLAISVNAFLHLECPQSNQYCTYPFTYTPQTELMVFDHQGFNTLKRGYAEQGDMKPCTKRFKQSMSGEDINTDAIKASLKTKLKARRVDNSKDSDFIASRSNSETNILPDQSSHIAICEGQQLVHHRNPHTGESSILFDMDGGKNGHAGSHVFDENQHYTIQDIPLELNKSAKEGEQQDSVAEYQSVDQGMHVVAAGYSDAVPPNTTVYIYTTHGGLPNEQVTVGENSEQVVLQEVSNTEAMHITGTPNFVKSHCDNDSNPELTVHRSALKFDYSQEQKDTVVNSMNSKNHNVQPSFHTFHVRTPSPQKPSVSLRSFSADIHNSTTVASSGPEWINNSSTSSPSGILDPKRILIPSKKISSSPWDVDGDEDSSTDTNIMVSDVYHLETSMVSTKMKSTSQKSSVFLKHPVSHMKTSGDVESPSNGLCNDSKQESVDSLSNKRDLTSMECYMNRFVSSANTDALPTIQVLEIAESLVRDQDTAEEY